MLDVIWLVAQNKQMKYIYGVVIPLLIQLLIVYLVIEMNAGNGSFVGLGAYLLGLSAIPLTAVINAIYVNMNPKLSISVVTARCFLIALITPILMLLMSALG